jgi:hypothetical protein
VNINCNALSICALSLTLGLSSCAELSPYYPAGDGNPRMGSVSQSHQSNRLSNISKAQARALAVSNGLTRQRALPPGIVRNLAKGKALPLGIAKQLLPQSMLGGLPSIEDHEWMQMGIDLVLVAIGTMIVIEILDGVFQ